MKFCTCYDPNGRCYGTKEIDRCSCRGFEALCDFYPKKRQAALAVGADIDGEPKPKGSFIYYAHHQWKYGTKVEEYELDLIKRYFPNSFIFNPSEHLNIEGKTEDEIMGECLNTVVNSDVIIFSAMDGMVGKGVYQEVTAAKGAGKLVLFITKNSLTTEFTLSPTPNTGTDRLYAEVTDFKYQ